MYVLVFANQFDRSLGTNQIERCFQKTKQVPHKRIFPFMQHPFMQYLLHNNFTAAVLSRLSQ